MKKLKQEKLFMNYILLVFRRFGKRSYHYQDSKSKKYKKILYAKLKKKNILVKIENVNNK